jgi:hypothetical protein
MVPQMVVLPGGTMATENRNVNERFRYLRMKQGRYGKDNRQRKARVLDEMEATSGLHRKYLIA